MIMTQILTGRRVLVVEDESLVAMLLETILEDMGCTPVGPAGTIEDGLAMVADPATLDAALLDVNVAGRQVFPVAEALKARGVPFVFSTGYGESGLPDAWRGHATVQKPFTEAAIREALMKAMGAENA
jgi:CheY-like chemotaxis protein